MPQEIERKFLVKNNSWKDEVSKSISIKQGYLNSNAERTVRVRITNNKAYLTIKSKSEGISRQEFEYEIPSSEAKELILLCEKPLIEKTRHEVKQGIHTWEIDVFEGENNGLILAEIELYDVDEKFKIPSWIGLEVSDDIRYYNSQLIKSPFTAW